MRTTLTLDDDIFTLLEQRNRESGDSMKQSVNALLRAGLAAEAQPTRKPFEVTPRRLGLPPGMSYDNVEELVEKISTPLHR